ncbi:MULTISPECIES: Crp/Fnr family transcriptional regulator [unclassified Schlesneria]|uniref:Crp/Fnr family transcriptional regulator n=1 Tax=Schlesneria TaxID=656899 RepID=UPI002EFD7DBD
MSQITPDDLKQFELLAGFRADELADLASRMTLLEYTEGDVVFSAGDSSRSLYLILSGRVQIDLIGNTVDETKLVVLGPNEIFGETTFFHEAAHNNTAWCQGPTRLAQLTYATYGQLLKSHSVMAYHLGANAAHILAARLQATDVWIREVLDRDEQIHRRELRERYHDVFHPSFSTPGGYVGLGGNW